LHASSQQGNANVALELLEWLKEQQPQPQPPPESESESSLAPVSYNSILNASAKSHSRAEELLNKMLQLSVTYTSVIHAWSNSEDPSPLSHAYRLYQQFLESSLRSCQQQPAVVMFVAIIQVWGKEQVQRTQALETARNVFQDLLLQNQNHPRGIANEVAFFTMLEAIKRLAKEEEEWLPLATLVF
jgi:hypothetical protein